uniref:Uncharacterized protein n=1 Tax=virus sp. ctx9V1 TaxID=2828001 RepID=A0A8S5RE12_9VIRU|nr:MAG TPA: hypothetical protein [virus sp. ctx9V1]
MFLYIVFDLILRTSFAQYPVLEESITPVKK